MRETLPFGGHRIYDRLVGRPLRRFYAQLAKERPETKAILDVGCGPGYLAHGLAVHHPEASVIGADLDATQIRIASRRKADNLRFEQQDARAMSFDDAAFDWVTTSESFHHWVDAHLGAEEVARVLKPGGQFWIIEGSGDMTKGEVSEWLGRRPLPGFTRICQRVFRKHGYTEAQIKEVVLPAIVPYFSRIVVERRAGWHIVKATK